MPVSVAPIDRKIRSLAGQELPQGGDQGAVLIVDRTPAAEVIVVPRDAQKSLARDIAPAGDVFEEGHHVCRLFGTAKRDDQDGIGHSYSL